MEVRIGVDASRLAVIARLKSRKIPALISANSLWDDRSKRFSKKWKNLEGLDVALDSGGFVAMAKYGRYRYTVDDYIKLVAKMKPTWWAAMDFCCEPEVAKDPLKVARRVRDTVRMLNVCQQQAAEARVPPPMPVIQGWQPEDYAECVRQMWSLFPTQESWPKLVGVGSVCRRHIHGPHGLLKVVRALDGVLPRHAKLHLFGVKGSALAYLAEHPRMESMDSMAWNMSARWHAIHHDIPASAELRAAFMERWFDNQTALAVPRQFSLAL